APFTELPDAFRTLQLHLLKKTGGDREMVDILALVLQHDEQAALSAVEIVPDLRCSDQDPYPQPASSPGRRQILHTADNQCSPLARAKQRAEGQCRAL